MSVASQDLAATAEQLRESLAAGSGGLAQPERREATDRERDPEVDAILSEWLLEPETDYEGTVTASNATTTGEDAHRLPPAKEQPEAGPGRAGRLLRLRRGPGRQKGPANR